MTNCLSNIQKTRLLKIQFIFWCFFHELIFNAIIVLLVILPSKKLNFKSPIFFSKKERNWYPRNQKIPPFWLCHHVSSTNIIIRSFTLTFSHKEFIRSKEEVNTQANIIFLILIADAINVSIIIGSQMYPSTKTSKIQIIKGLSTNKENQY